MNKKRKRAFKGFTLIELIIVMALFSIIMLAVMRIASPASNIMKNTAISENTYANADNMSQYVKGQLQYADSLWVLSGDKDGVLGADADKLKYSSPRYGSINNIEKNLDAVVQAYYDEYYKDSVVYGNDDATLKTKSVEGKIYVMRLVNIPNAVGNHHQGQITLKTYTFDKNGTKPVGAEVEQLSNAMFEGNNSVYNYNYILGAHNFNDGAISSGGKNYRTLKADNPDGLAADKTATIASMGYNDLAVSIVINKHTKTAGETGYRDVIDDDTVNEYRMFETPCTISVANIPLINVSFNQGKVSQSYRIVTPVDKPKAVEKYGDDATEELSTALYCGGTSNFLSDDAGFSNDIYFIYSYANELK